MSDQVPTVQTVIGVEEHAWTAGLRDALLKFGGDDVDRQIVSLLLHQLGPAHPFGQHPDDRVIAVVFGPMPDHFGV